METIYFTEENHIYQNEKGFKYDSVSGLWKPYFSKFDAKSVSIKKAYKELDSEIYEASKQITPYDSPDFINVLKDNSNIEFTEIKNQADSYVKIWTAKAQKGTDFHNKEENKDYDRGYRINPFTNKKSKIITWGKKEGFANQSFPGNLFKDLPDGYIAEHLVSNLESYTAGQLDQNFIETIGKTRYIDIDDWKTDEKVLIKPTFFNRKKGGYQKMSYPVNHIYETNYWKYVMKISTYAKFLEKAGFTVRNLAFTHVVIDENLEILKETRYKLPYKSFEVDLILKNKIENLDL